LPVQVLGLRKLASLMARHRGPESFLDIELRHTTSFPWFSRRAWPPCPQFYSNFPARQKPSDSSFPNPLSQRIQ